LGSDPLFSEMLGSPKNSLDLFEQLNEPKVIVINTAGLGSAMEPFGRYFIAKLEEAIFKRKFVPKSSKLPVYFYVDEAGEYYGHEPRVKTTIDRLGKQGLATIFAAQGTDHFSAEVLSAMQRAAIQAWTLEWPIVNISLNHKEPVQVSVQRIDVKSLPSISEAEFDALCLRMQERFGATIALEPSPLGNANASTKEPKTSHKHKKPMEPSAATPKSPDADETDAKP
jgi:hypothetical protein